MQETKQNKISILSALEICLERQVQFAAYRLPDGNPMTIVIQRDGEIQPLTEMIDSLPEEGFLITPFSTKENHAYLIKPDIVIRDAANPDQLETLRALSPRYPAVVPENEPEDTEKTAYLELIRDSIRRISAGEFEKVVLSRVKSVTGHFTAHLTGIFQALCEAYPSAFVYLFQVNGQCWTGATPEPFICSRKGELNTVSLAGTRPFRTGNLEISNWNHKETEEQEYVTLYIEKILKEYGVTDYNRKGPYVARAGNVVHLRTDFSFPALSVGDRLPALIHALHPTPAVCGMSAIDAFDFIRISEKHNREFYSGFLGPVGIDDLLQLYVNLRCLKVHDDRLVLYIGGGITHDSIPEEEWEETEIKADTLLSVINQIR